MDNYIGLPNLNCLPLTAFDFWATMKVHDSVFSSILLPIYNRTVFEVAASQAKFELLVDIQKWLDPDIFEVNVIMSPQLYCLKVTGRNMRTEKLPIIQRMPVTIALFPERRFPGCQKGKIQG